MYSCIRNITLAWLMLSALSPLHAQPALGVFPSEPFQASGLPRGPFQPSRKEYVLTNTSSSALAWSTLKSQPWFSISEPGGDLEPGASTRVQVYPNSLALELGPGTYAGTLTFTIVGVGKAWSGDVQLDIALPGPGRLEAVFVTVTNQYQLILTGDSGSVFLLEDGEDFNAWTPVLTNVFASEVERISVDLGLKPRRYFRASSLESNVSPIRLVLTNTYLENLTQLRLLGDPGGTYLVEASRDETNWIPVLTNKLPVSGSVLFDNPLGGDESDWSYRVSELGIFPVDPLHHILIVGQSLAVGVRGQPVLSSTPSEVHYRFFGDGIQSFMTRLVETGVETIASGAGNQVAATASGHRLLFSNAGVPMAVYEQLKKGTPPYATGVRQFREAPQAAAWELLGYLPRAIFVLHGEGDHINPEYDLNIRQWQQDYELDIRNVTGQDVSVPMFHSQVSAWTKLGDPPPQFTLGAFKVLEESERYPDKTILVCPKYIFTYADGLHLTNTSYRWLGEYYAKAYRKVIVEGGTWTPLKPLEITRSNTVITARFHVPVPPLVLDTTHVIPPDPVGLGFEFHDASGLPPSIVSVTLTGPDTVEIELSAEPTGPNERLRYAYTGIPGSSGGPETGPRGNLRDSDPEPSLYGNPLFNWCVHFDKPVEVIPANP